jgi:acetoin utilization deacetylase AcuC-like enzyme
LPEVLHSFRPDFVFYQSGVDILAGDKLGRLNISPEGCKARDRFVLESCKALNLPVAASMGGGYSPRIATIIEAHAQTFRLAKEIYF